MKGEMKTMLFKFNNKLQYATREMLLILLFILVLFYLRWISSHNDQYHQLITNRSTDKLNKQIFILAGQSNMAGQGGVHNFTWNRIIPRECQPDPYNILRLKVNMKWEIAHEPLNYAVDCLESCGVGPGMVFANAILKRDPNFGVIGLVPCSRSGTGIDLWNRGNFPYEQLLSRAKVSLRDGGIIRGLLWYHGESDSKRQQIPRHYKSKLIKFIRDLRADLNSSILPVVMVVLHYPKEELAKKFKFVNVVRQAQMDIDLPNVIKVDAKGLPVGSDGIHLTTQGQIQLGNMMAQAFLNTKFQSVKFNSNKIYHMM